jgi:GNAT superfamily N-acetyltransferase
MTPDARDQSDSPEKRHHARSIEGQRLRARMEQAQFEQQTREAARKADVGRAVELREHEVNDREWSNHRIRRDGKDIGAVSVSYDESGKRAELVDLHIHDRKDRGKGTGSEVVRRVEQEASARGMKEIRADMSDAGMAPEDRGSPEARKRLMRFYEKQGWEVRRIEDPESPVFAKARKGIGEKGRGEQ